MEFIEFRKEPIGDRHLELALRVCAQDVDALIAEAYGTLAQKVDIEPEGSIAELRERLLVGGRYEKDDLARVVKGYVLSRIAPYAVDHLEEETITQPKFFCELPPEPGVDFDARVIVMLKPKLELSSLSPVVVKLPEVEVDDDEIEAQLLEFAASGSDFIPNDLQRPLEMGDLARIDSEVNQEGKKLGGLCGKDNLLEVTYDSMPREFIDAIVGMEVDETRSFCFGIDGEGDYRATVTLRRLMQRKVPEITDAWVRERYPAFDTVDDLKESLRSQFLEKLESKRADVKDLAVDYALLDRLQGAIPDEVYEFVMGNMTENFKMNLKKIGLSQGEFFSRQNITEEEYMTNMMLEARRALRQSLALDALFRGLHMELEQSDIDEVLTNMAPGREEELYEEMLTKGRRYVILEEARREKAHRWLVDTAVYESA